MSATTMLTPDELAARWRMNVKTLSNWRAYGRGPRFLKLGIGRNTRVLYPESDVLDYERENMKGKK